MRVGDIVKLPDTFDFKMVKGVPERYEIPGGIRRVESFAYAGGLPHVNGVTYKEYEPELVTVSDLFREAGFPVPDGASVHVSGCDLTWWAMGPDANEYGGCGCLFRFVSVEDGHMWVIQTDDPKDCEATLEVDQSRTPAANTWGCLPEAVKKVVEVSS